MELRLVRKEALVVTYLWLAAVTILLFLSSPVQMVLYARTVVIERSLEGGS
jgi:hypothetical protein